MKMTNYEIYMTTKALEEAFNNKEQYLPIKVSFYIQKNKALLLSLSQNIEDLRMTIVRNYGALNEDGTAFEVPQDKIEIANKELSDLFNIEQEVNILQISLEAFPDDIQLTNKQMEALMFMINN